MELAQAVGVDPEDGVCGGGTGRAIGQEFGDKALGVDARSGTGVVAREGSAGLPAWPVEVSGDQKVALESVGNGNGDSCGAGVFRGFQQLAVCA